MSGERYTNYSYYQMAKLTSKLGVSVGDDVGKLEGSMFVGTSVGIELGPLVVGLKLGAVVGYNRNDEKQLCV